MIVIACKNGGDRGEQIIDQVPHIIFKLKRFTRWKLDRVRLMRLLKIMHIDPITRDRAARRFCFQQAHHQRAFAHARRPHDEQVIAFALDGETEIHRINRTRLAEHAGQIRQFLGRGKRQTG